MGFMKVVTKDPVFEQAARDHVEGRVTLSDFFRISKPHLARLATHLMNHWSWCTPPCVGHEDLVQELMVGCVWAFKRYDPTRVKNNGSIGRYVSYNAYDKAKKWIHRQRGAVRHGNADGNLSRHALLFHDLAGKRGEEQEEAEIEWLSKDLQTDPLQHVMVERHEIWHVRLRQAPTVRLRWGIVALESTRGEQGAAAKRLYENQNLRLRLRLGSEKDARKIIWETVRYLTAA